MRSCIFHIAGMGDIRKRQDEVAQAAKLINIHKHHVSQPKIIICIMKFDVIIIIFTAQMLVNIIKGQLLLQHGKNRSISVAVACQKGL